METIMGWLGDVPWTTVGATVLTFAVGFLMKQSGYSKAVDTLADVADLVNDYVKAQADGKVDAAETQELVNDIKHIVSDYAGKK